MQLLLYNLPLVWFWFCNHIPLLLSTEFLYQTHVLCNPRSVLLFALGTRLLELKIDFTHFLLAGFKVLLLLCCKILTGGKPDEVLDSILAGPLNIRELLISQRLAHQH